MKEKGYVLGIAIRYDRLTRFVDQRVNVFVNLAVGRKSCLFVYNNL